MLRIALFLLTNIAVLVVASITMRLLGIDNYFYNGTGVDLGGMLVFCALIGFGGSFISLFLSKWMAKMSTRTQIITSPGNATEKWLMETVAELSQKAGIRMPEVGIFPAQQSNAFATGWNKNDALVAVSAGLLHRFNRDEVRAVLAHEIGHVANGDMVTLSLIQGVVNTFVMFLARIVGMLVDSAMRGNDRSGGPGIGYWIATIVAEIVFGILASMVVFAFSRWREYRADAAGAQLAGKQSMINALRRLQEETQAKVPNQMPDTLTAFGISGGFKESLGKLFLTHPPLEQRIRALENRSPAAA